MRICSHLFQCFLSGFWSFLRKFFLENLFLFLLCLFCRLSRFFKNRWKFLEFLNLLLDFCKACWLALMLFVLEKFRVFWNFLWRGQANVGVLLMQCNSSVFDLTDYYHVPEMLVHLRTSECVSCVSDVSYPCQAFLYFVLA